MKAVWNGAVVAQSGDTVVVEGNHYFPPESVRREFFAGSGTVTTCSWKGQASYYTLTVDGRTNPDAAWVYRSPSPAAAGIAGYIAFRRGVQVVDDDT